VPNTISVEHLQEVLHQQETTTNLIITVAGFIFVILIGIVGFFIRSLVIQQRKNTELIGRQVGRLNTLDEVTKGQLHNLNTNMEALSRDLKDHTRAIDERMTQKDETNTLLIELLKTMVSNSNGKKGS